MTLCMNNSTSDSKWLLNHVTKNVEARDTSLVLGYIVAYINMQTCRYIPSDIVAVVQAHTSPT